MLAHPTLSQAVVKAVPQPAPVSLPIQHPGCHTSFVTLHAAASSARGRTRLTPILSGCASTSRLLTARVPRRQSHLIFTVHRWPCFFRSVVRSSGIVFGELYFRPPDSGLCGLL
jgi:hypothetical protein